MLKGTSITLRPVHENDLDQLYAYHMDIDNRGDFFPRGVLSQPAYRKHFQESGFWSKDDGMLVIVNAADEILGHIEFFKTVNYLDEYELSYQVYATDQRNKGIATEAVNLLVRYLFQTKNINRIRLVIHPGNVASRRLAEKVVGFFATARTSRSRSSMTPHFQGRKSPFKRAALKFTHCLWARGWRRAPGTHLSLHRAPKGTCLRLSLSFRLQGAAGRGVERN
jgi:ribosomal-protein-alanine N-acetyltransferase